VPSKSNINLRRLCFTAMLVAMALVMRLFFSVTIPLMGEAGMRISVHGIFSSLPAILFGAMWGAISSGANDILGYILRPEGAYLPQITLVAASGGFLRGVLWLLLRKRNPNKIRIAILIFGIAVLGFGVANYIVFAIDGVTRDFFLAYELPDTSNMFFISRAVIARADAAANSTRIITETITHLTFAPVGAGIFALLLFGIDLLMSRGLRKDFENGNKEYVSIMPLLLTMLAAAWWQSTLNTMVLRTWAVPAWQELPFWMLWLPRILQSTITTTVNTYFVALLLGVFKKQKYLLPYLR